MLAGPKESMLTLFTAITGGMNWEDAMVPLRDPRLNVCSDARVQGLGFRTLGLTV